MRITLLSIILIVIGAVMMGCTDNIIPCTVDEDCVMDWGYGGDSDAADWGGDFGMVCTDVSPVEECARIASYLDFLPDFLPIDITIDCSEFEGMDDLGTCGSSWSPF